MGSSEIVVVGAGPAGLTAAWQAATAGHRVVLVERASVVGGMAASITVAGQRVDLGSHRLHPAASPRVLAAVQQLLGGDLQERTRNGRIRFDGRWVAFPLRPDDLLRTLPNPLKARLARDLALRPVRRRPPDTFGGVVGAGLGPTVLRHVYEPYARKLWDAAPHELDGDLARRRVSADGPAAIARRLLARPGRGRSFLYPRLGYGQIVEALADAATAAGVEIRLQTAVTTVEPRADGATIHLDGGRLDAGHVLWTAPLSGLVRTARPAAPAPVVDALGRLRHRAAVLAYLVLDRSQWTTFDAHYIPDADNPVARLSEPKNYRDGPDPDGTTVLCAELPCWVGDPVWRADPAELGAIVVDAIARAGLPPVTPVAVESRRLPNVYPVYRAGYGRSLARALGWTEGLDAVTVLGRQGTFVPDNLHHVMEMGWDAADALRPGPVFDRAAWRHAQERHARHVVED